MYNLIQLLLLSNLTLIKDGKLYDLHIGNNDESIIIINNLINNKINFIIHNNTLHTLYNTTNLKTMPFNANHKSYIINFYKNPNGIITPSSSKIHKNIITFKISKKYLLKYLSDLCNTFDHTIKIKNINFIKTATTNKFIFY